MENIFKVPWKNLSWFCTSKLIYLEINTNLFFINFSFFCERKDKRIGFESNEKCLQWKWCGALPILKTRHFFHSPDNIKKLKILCILLFCFKFSHEKQIFEILKHHMYTQYFWDGKYLWSSMKKNALVPYVKFNLFGNKYKFFKYIF